MRQMRTATRRPPFGIYAQEGACASMPPVPFDLFAYNPAVIGASFGAFFSFVMIFHDTFDVS